MVCRSTTRFDPGRRERRAFDAKAGINDDKAFGEKLRKVLRLAVRSREANTRGLRDIIDADEDEIETPCADASRFQIQAKCRQVFR